MKHREQTPIAALIAHEGVGPPCWSRATWRTARTVAHRLVAAARYAQRHLCAYQHCAPSLRAHAVASIARAPPHSTSVLISCRPVTAQHQHAYLHAATPRDYAFHIFRASRVRAHCARRALRAPVLRHRAAVRHTRGLRMRTRETLMHSKSRHCRCHRAYARVPRIKHAFALLARRGRPGR